MKDKLQHTPGPWEYHDKYKGSKFRIWRTGENQYGICDICTSRRVFPNPEPEPGAEALANAALISAAPDLMEALRYASELIETARQYFPKSIKHSDTFQLNNVCATVSKAINKATGAA